MPDDYADLVAKLKHLRERTGGSVTMLDPDFDKMSTGQRLLASGVIKVPLEGGKNQDLNQAFAGGSLYNPFDGTEQIPDPARVSYPGDIALPSERKPPSGSLVALRRKLTGGK